MVGGICHLGCGESRLSSSSEARFHSFSLCEVWAGRASWAGHPAWKPKITFLVHSSMNSSPIHLSYCPSKHPPVHLFTCHLYIHLSIHLPIYPSTYHLPIHPSIDPSIHQSCLPYIHSFINPSCSIHPSVHSSSIHLSIHPSIHPSIEPSIHHPSILSPIT